MMEELEEEGFEMRDRAPLAFAIATISVLVALILIIDALTA